MTTERVDIHADALNDAFARAIEIFIGRGFVAPAYVDLPERGWKLGFEKHGAHWAFVVKVPAGDQTFETHLLQKSGLAIRNQAARKLADLLSACEAAQTGLLKQTRDAADAVERFITGARAT